MPRVAPITSTSDVPAEHQAVADAVVRVFGNIRGPFSMLLHSPKLAERMLGLVTFFRDESAVEPKLRSVAILTAVREREAAYVWAAQVAAARRNGVAEDVIDILRSKGDAGKLPEREREIVTYTRQLMRTNRVDQAAFDALAKRYSVAWLVELTAAVNYFALLSGVVNAFEVAAPPDGDKLPIRPPGWQQEHMRRYIETDGRDGHIWEGVPTLLLTTMGRRSGQSRTTPLIYGQAGAAYVVVASRGGAPLHPDWYQNLVAQPEVQVQVMAERFKARARTATAAEKPALWKTMTSIWPAYDDYQTRTTREIPVVVIEPV
jgi:deazaflavin-dependent oxidoreductase (nitroreductase family)